MGADDWNNSDALPSGNARSAFWILRNAGDGCPDTVLKAGRDERPKRLLTVGSNFAKIRGSTFGELGFH
jgi:hypothetical protein